MAEAWPELYYRVSMYATQRKGCGNFEKRKQANLLVFYESATGNHGCAFHVGRFGSDGKRGCEPQISGCSTGSSERKHGYVGGLSGKSSCIVCV